MASDNVFDFDTSKDVKAVQAFERTLDKLDQTIEKLDRKDINKFKKQIESLNDSPSVAMKSLASEGEKMATALDAIHEGIKKKMDVKGLAANARTEFVAFRQQIETTIREIQDLDGQMSKLNLVGRMRAQAAEATRVAKTTATPFTALPSSLTQQVQQNMPSRDVLLAGQARELASVQAQGEALYNALNVQASRVNAGGASVLKEYKEYYAQLEADSKRKADLWSRVNNPTTVAESFRSLTASIEAGSSASAKALRDHYADLERISNVKSAINSRLAGATTLGPVGMPTDKISRTDANDAIYKTSMANMRVYYEQMGAIRNKDVEADSQAAVKKMANADLISKAYAQVKAASIQASGVYSTLNSGKLVDPTELDRLGAGYRKLSVDTGTLHGVTRGLAAGFGQLWLAWGQLAPMLTGAGIGFGLKKTFDIGSEVEYNIKFMQVLGDQTKETGSAVRAELRAIDQTTLFSLAELSKAMVMLGQAGLSPKESLQTLRPAADLATAGMVDLDTSTKLLIQTHALFGKTSADTAKTAAQLFVATKSGVLNVEDLAGSMKYASEINTRFGGSLEEALTMLGALAQAGLKGSSGGTALINFYRDINGRSGPAIKAMETLRKVSGDTIKIFDDAGKQRSIIDIFDEVAKASEKLSSSDADKVLNKLFSDRGGRTFFAMVRDGTIDLKKMQSLLENTKPDTLFDAAKGLMDTTKGAVDQLQGALVGQMDIVFEKYADGFKDVIKGITAAINSQEFRATLDSIVRSALTLYNVISSMAAPIAIFLGSMMAFKAVGIVNTIFTGMGVAISGASIAMGALSATTGISTAMSLLSVEGNVAAGAALFGRAAAARMAAAGENELAIAAARSAAVTAASTGTMRLASGALGLLANPIVALGVVLALGAVAWWNYSNAAKDATGDLSDSIVSNGKVAMDQWDKEIAKLKSRNALLSAGKYGEIENAIAKVEAGIITYENDTKGVEKDNKMFRTLGMDKAADGVYSKYNKELDDRKANLARMKKDLAGMRDDDEKQEAARTAKAEAKAKLVAGNPRATGADITTPGKPAAAYDKSIRLLDDNGLEKLKTSMDQRYVTLQKGYDNEKKLLDARYKAGLETEGEYQLKSMQQTLGYEADNLQSRREDMAKMETQYKDQAAKIKDLMATANAKGATANVSELKQKLENLDNTWDTYKKASNEKTLQIESDAALRLKLSLIEAQGALRSLMLTSNSYRETQRARLDSQAMDTSLTDAYRFQDKSAFSDDPANLAASQAQRAEIGNHKQRLMELSEAVDKARRNYDTLINSTDDSEKSTDAWIQAANIQRQAIQANSDAFKDLSDDTSKWGQEAGKRAFDKVKKDQTSDLAGGIADSVLTGINEGGAAGAKSLRALIQKELINEPLKVLLQAQITGLMGTGNAGGSSGLLGGLIDKGLGLLGMGKTAGLDKAIAGNDAMAAAATQSSAADGLADFMNGFDVGNPYIPNDQVAKIHRGERIMTASENAAYSAGNGQSAGKTVHFNPVMSIQIDARADRASIRKEVSSMIETNNKQTQENMRRNGWTDA